jgi:hypothetical protein
MDTRIVGVGMQLALLLWEHVTGRCLANDGSHTGTSNLLFFTVF